MAAHRRIGLRVARNGRRAVLAGLGAGVVGWLWRGHWRVAEAAPPRDVFDDFMRKVEMVRTGHELPGVAAALVRGDQDVAFATGVAKAGADLSAQTTTVFGLASITKTFTATTAMRLVEQGKLNLDAPVRGYVPTFLLADQTAAAAITMRHLLTHTSGLPRDADEWPSVGDGDDAVARWVDQFADLEVDDEPGASYAYSNLGFNLAGRVIEVVSGMPFDAAVRQLVLQPLGMERSGFRASEIGGTEAAWGHEGGDDTPVAPFAVARAEWSDGGLASCAVDMIRYARSFMPGAGGARVLTRPSVDEMLRVQADGEDGPLGLAWSVRGRGGTRVISHEGFYAGFHTDLAIAPERKVAVVVLINSDTGYDAKKEVVEWALARLVQSQGADRARLTSA